MLLTRRTRLRRLLLISPILAHRLHTVAIFVGEEVAMARVAI